MTDSQGKHLRPTHYYRWRALSQENDARQRSLLEQLWVDDAQSTGEWRQVPRVPFGAPSAWEPNNQSVGSAD